MFERYRVPMPRSNTHTMLTKYARANKVPHTLRLYDSVYGILRLIFTIGIGECLLGEAYPVSMVVGMVVCIMLLRQDDDEERCIWL